MLVLVPGLDWAHAPIVLGGLARTSLSVRAAPARSGAVDGYLTVNKGARSGAPAGVGAGRVVPRGGGLRLADWARLRRHDAGLRVPGRLGALGDALQRAALSPTLVYRDPSAAVAAADHGGVVPRAIRGGPEAVRAALAEGARAVVVQTTVAELPSVVAAGDRSCVLVASPNTPHGSTHLGVLAASAPCGLGTGGLSSPATHQAHLATLPDVTATFLATLGVGKPADTQGQRVRPASPVAVHTLVEQDRRTVAADHARARLLWLVIGLQAVGAALALVWLRLRLFVTLVLLAVPPAGFLMMLLPWWHWGVGGGALALGLIAVAVAGIATFAGRRDPIAAVAVVAAGGALLVLLDAAFGGHLEIDAPFGNSPVVAGRFYGLGNVGLGFAVGGLLIGAGVALDRYGRRAVPWVIAVLGGALVVAGAPVFGAKVGAALTCVPAFAAFALVYGAVRPTWRTVTVAGLATVAVVGVFAAVDLALPARLQTDLARWLEGGHLGVLLSRKATEALGNITSPLGLVIVVGLGALGLARPHLGSRALRAAAWSVVVAAVVGSVLNDSGIVVGAAVVAVAWPAFLVLGSTPENATA